MQEMFQEGILILGTHNVSTSISKPEISAIENAYAVVLRKISKALKQGTLKEQLRVQPLKPLFRIR